ncbi:MAG: phosphoadenylyl-sulfate reductase [Dehalococcoidia bacterium]|nr:phosphoadenylyl-sulfate reductase [Dehalococcoidia bacterium]
MAQAKARGDVYTPEELARFNLDLEERAPRDVLRWAVDRFFPGLTVACSFGGPSGMVLVDMIAGVEPRVEVFYLDPDFLFPETYDTRDRVIERYGIQPVAYKSRLTPEQQAQEHRPELWLTNPDLCCQLRKVEPNARALEGKRAWISGIRRDQGATRVDVPIVQWDDKFGLVKVNPLARWTEADVWAYIVKHDVPYNPLHDRNYPSIGCTYCTKAVLPGDDPRSGRWQGQDKTECGIHMPEGPIPVTRGDEATGS